MRISEIHQTLILDEFQFVLEKMESALPLDEKLFYFSALHGTVNRVMNFECTSELLFLHHILNVVFQAFNGRVQAFLKGGDTIVKIDDSMIEKLCEYTRELADRLRSGDDPSSTYSKLISLSYATTGNGYYLYQRGLLKI